jgi:hypothetical protein
MTARTSDGLPLSHEGAAINWQPWEKAPVLTHVDQSCDGCGHEGPILIAKGYAVTPATSGHPERRLLRFWAFRCPGCRETRVCERVHVGPLESEMVMIEYLRPRIEMGSIPPPA